VWVDSSADGGRTFSPAVAVNPAPKPIKARGEDHPAIAVDGRGRIYVLYSQDDAQPWTAFVSVSNDGQTFTPPVPVSDRAATARHYQTKLAVSAGGRAYVFWNDERDAGGAQNKTNIYYTTLDGSGQPGSARRLTENSCPCCRLAVDMSGAGPVLFYRQIFGANLREHALLRPSGGGPQQVTDDDWHMDGCPEQGPGLAMAGGRAHLVWFTQGSKRQGIFYAHAEGGRISDPVPVGSSPGAMASHASVAAVGKHVVVVWKETDGQKTSILAMHSRNGGEQWSAPQALVDTAGGSDHPFLLTRGVRIYLSWTAADRGYLLLPVN
jgi:hypothetical protein